MKKTPRTPKPVAPPVRVLSPKDLARVDGAGGQGVETLRVVAKPSDA